MIDEGRMHLGRMHLGRLTSAAFVQGIDGVELFYPVDCVVPSQRDAMGFDRRRSMRYATPRAQRSWARDNRRYVNADRYARSMNARNKARENMRKYKSKTTYKRASSQYKKGKISKQALMKHKDYKGYAWNMIKRLK